VHVPPNCTGNSLLSITSNTVGYRNIDNQNCKNVAHTTQIKKKKTMILQENLFQEFQFCLQYAPTIPKKTKY
jgi:hypothetical protein